MKDLKKIKDTTNLFIDKEASDYVNIHPYCLHIWKPINQEIPTPPRILV